MVHKKFCSSNTQTSLLGMQHNLELLQHNLLKVVTPDANSIIKISLTVFSIRLRASTRLFKRANFTITYYKITYIFGTQDLLHKGRKYT